MFDARRSTPTSICITDMDWHTAQTDYRSMSWADSTWNQECLSESAGIAAWLYEQGRRTLPNLHPDDGVQGSAT